MKVELVPYWDFLNGKSFYENVKYLIACADKKDFNSTQIAILERGMANFCMPLLLKKLDFRRVREYLIELKLCQLIDGELETLALQSSNFNSEQFGPLTSAAHEHREISILVRQWDAFEMTSACLNSLMATDYSSKRILLLDDASTDDSYLKIFLSYKEVHVVRTLDKLEYCHSFNLLAKYAQKLGSRSIFIVNNDTCEFSANIFEELEQNLTQDVGITSSRVRDYSGSVIVKQDRKWLGIPFNIATEGYLIPLAVWNRIGGFNPYLVRYTEDLEIVREMQKLGLGQKRVDTVYFSHLGNGSSSRQNFIPIYFAARNLVWIQKIYFPLGNRFKMVMKSAEKTWPGVLKKNTLTGKRSLLVKILYLILGLIRGAFTNCHPRNPHTDPYLVLFKPPMRFTQKLR